jgi:hypothetical protein
VRRVLRGFLAACAVLCLPGMASAFGLDLPCGGTLILGDPDSTAVQVLACPPAYAGFAIGVVAAAPPSGLLAPFPIAPGRTLGERFLYGVLGGGYIGSHALAAPMLVPIGCVNVLQGRPFW